MKVVSVLLSLAFLTALPLRAADANPPEWIQQAKVNYQGQTDRPLRYRPVGTDFVITNGAEFFNRPLYCLNTAFRVDGVKTPSATRETGIPKPVGNDRTVLPGLAGLPAVISWPPAFIKLPSAPEVE